MADKRNLRAVQRLSGLDASFLYTESPALHMHTLKIGIIDPAGATAATRSSASRTCSRRGCTCCRRSVARRSRCRSGCTTRVWVEDEAFDLERHIRRMQRGRAGIESRARRRDLGDRVDAAATRSAAVGDHRRRGARGRPGRVRRQAAPRRGRRRRGRAAARQRDGAGAGDHRGRAADASRGGASPCPARPISRSVRSATSSRCSCAFPALIVRTLRRLRDVMRTRREASHVPPNVFQGPRTSFNGPLTPRRGYASITLPLEDFRKVKAAFDCTINDVVLAVVTGAVRDLLLDGRRAGRRSRSSPRCRCPATRPTRSG